MFVEGEEMNDAHTGKNEGLKEVGKGFIALGNLILVLFLLNTYLQKEDFDIIGILLSLYAVIMLYTTGYTAIKKGEGQC